MTEKGSLRSFDINRNASSRGLTQLSHRSPALHTDAPVTVSAMDSYAEALTQVGTATEHIENSNGGQDFLHELESMLKGVYGTVQRVFVMQGQLEQSQLAYLASELEGLVAAVDDNMDSHARAHLHGSVSRLVKQSEYLRGVGGGLPPSVSPNSMALALPGAADGNAHHGSELAPHRAQPPPPQQHHQQQQQSEPAVHLQADQLRQMLFEPLQRMMSQYHEPYFWRPPAYSGAMAPAHGQEGGASGGRPITIHNHLGVEQKTNATSDATQKSQQEASLKAKMLQHLKQASSGPWGFVMAGVAGLLVREVAGRALRLGGGRGSLEALPPPDNSREIRKLRGQQKALAKEALRQLHACERAFLKVKERPIKTPFDAPGPECAPDYMVFEAPELE
uniref:Uncharacterized protein n=1 Tax=Tetraselmis sp. GSL018 TaxID=582737 RepID=A0A061QTM5_9CHLO|eukprot:CAMPEP_0177609666 /NCGR_PEP_ID=MMETSP0419_2-20121207/19246_1 /TAXON_ID=582737 /ORGANISM="Tetraselmis sp., Strain GSL018" /LENGTH=391 /DNA_ID=CAMNT_0019104677 /DNA_START=111 /DNA_END=1286 /DNA_ORIENTATION=+